jgi:hypothetical protein
MSDGEVPRKLGQCWAVKDFAHKAHTLSAFYDPIPGNRDAGAFLPPMLERKEAVIDQGHHIAVCFTGIDPENAAFFVEFIIHHPSAP